MRNLVSSLILTVLISTQVFAGLPPTTLSGIGDTTKPTTFTFRTPTNQATKVNGVESMIETGNSNLLKNPGAEGGTTNWTASAGTFTATTTAGELLVDKKSFSWDSSAATQTVTSDAITIPIGLRGRNAVMSCLFAVQSGTATTTMSVYDGSVSTQTTTITSSSTPTRTSVNFVAASSGTVAIRLASVAADEPKILWDSCYIGPADTYNISQVNQAVLYGSANYASTTNCDWSSTTPASTFSADADCPSPTVSGQASAPSTKIPGITFSNGLPPGDYLIVFQGDLYSTRATSNTQSHLSISDGTNRTNSSQISGLGTGTTVFTAHISNMTGRLAYTSAQAGPITFQPYIEDVNTTVHVDAHITGLQILVYRFPTTSELALRPEMLALSWSGYTDNAATWSRTNTAFGDPTVSGTPALVERTNTNFGAVTTAASNLPGITFTPKKTGKYHVCATTRLASLTANNQLSTSLTDGTVVIAQNNALNYADGTNTSGPPQTLCGLYNVTSLAAVTLKIQIASSTGSATLRAHGANLSSIEWEIYAIDQGLPAPVLVGSVTSNSTGAERVERVSLSSASPAVTSNESGDWINGTCTRSGTSSSIATCTFNSGIFSAAPVCTASEAAGNLRMASVVTTATTFAVTTGSASGGGTLSADAVNVICVGPK